MLSPFMVQTLPAKFGNYLLREFLAFGGTSEIFLAETAGGLGAKKTVIIKRILPQYCEDRLFIKMLVSEAKLCVGLQHSNIVQIFELGRVRDRTFIAMEYVPGHDLAAVRDLAWAEEGELPMEIVGYVMSEALQGLDFAHAATDATGRPLGIVHRDFNPTNILLSWQGEVKLTDFGMAKATQRSSNTVSSLVKGKIAYLSPEQVLAHPLDARSDIFSAGITLWELLAGRPLLAESSYLRMMERIRDADFPDLRQVAPAVPGPLADIVQRALQRRPEDRFQSAGEFKAALDEFFRGCGISLRAAHLDRYLWRICGPEAHEQTSPFPAAESARPQKPIPVAAPVEDDGDTMPLEEEDTEVTPPDQVERLQGIPSLLEESRRLVAQSRPWEALERLDQALQVDPRNERVDQAHASLKAELVRRVFERLQSLSRIPVLAVELERLKDQPLDNRAGFLLSQMDGLTSIDDLVALCGLPQLPALRLLVELLDRRFIELR